MPASGTPTIVARPRRSASPRAERLGRGRVSRIDCSVRGVQGMGSWMCVYFGVVQEVQGVRPKLGPRVRFSKRSTVVGSR